MRAGELRPVSGATGEGDRVAVKVLQPRGALQRDLRAARRELAIMCAVAGQLAGFAVQLRGFYEDVAAGTLELVMERGERTVAEWFDGAPEGRLPLRDWARRCHSPMPDPGLLLHNACQTCMPEECF